MNNLKDIHNIPTFTSRAATVVLSGCQWTIWRIYTTCKLLVIEEVLLFYQDVNEQFEGYTQQFHSQATASCGCFIRMSMNNLKDIHNCRTSCQAWTSVVLSGCQWTIWRIYTTHAPPCRCGRWLFYQDVNEQFEGYTQRYKLQTFRPPVVLSGCQWTIWRIYTTAQTYTQQPFSLFYQDVNEQFEGYTQP